MKTMRTFPVREPWAFRETPPIYHAAAPPPQTRVLPEVDSNQSERVLLGWHDQLLGPGSDQRVIVDGKRMRHGVVQIVTGIVPV
jgi:hypothetical protein